MKRLPSLAAIVGHFTLTKESLKEHKKTDELIMDIDTKLHTR